MMHHKGFFKKIVYYKDKIALQLNYTIDKIISKHHYNKRKRVYACLINKKSLLEERGLFLSLRTKNKLKKGVSRKIKIAYYMGLKSYQFIPYIKKLLYDLPGTVYAHSEEIIEFLKKDYPRLKCRYFKLFDHNTYIRMVDEWGESFDVVIFFDYFNDLDMMMDIRLATKLSDTKLIQVFHGTSDKNYIINEEASLYDLIIVPGKRDFDRLNDKKNVKMVGSFKLDKYFNNEINRDELRKRFQLHNNQKVILYAPTWEDIRFSLSHSSFKWLMPELIDKKIKKFTLVIKPHPILFTANPRVVKYIHSKLSNKENIIFLSEDQFVDTLDLMAISDILITDISSVSSEFLAFNKPIIFYDHPCIKNNEEEKWIWQCGDVVDNVDDLFKAIETNMKNPRRHEKKRKECARELFYKLDGKSTERAVREIIKILN